MNEIGFEARLDRVRKAAEVIEALPKKLQDQAFQYLIGSARAADTPVGSNGASATQNLSERAPQFAHADADAGGNGAVDRSTDTANAGNGNGASRKVRRGGSKSNKAVPQDREIDLFPEGKASFADFAAEKSPRTIDEKYSVAVYWILRVAELPKATIAQVVSCFLVAEWSLPSQVANAASQARKAGFLSVSKADDLQLTSIGINLVNKQLPRPAAK